MCAAEIRGRRVEAMHAFRQWQWPLDEVYVKIDRVPRSRAALCWGDAQ